MIRKLLRYYQTPKYRSAGLTFFLMSVLFAFWVTRLPEVRDRLGISEGEIGLALFFIPMGALLAMLISHSVNRKAGEGRVMVIGLILLSISGIFPVLAGSYTILCLALFVFGFFMGLTDISMNAVVSILEKRDKVQIMAMSHGFFSLGGMIGGALGSIIGGAGISPVAQMMVTALIIVLIAVFDISPVIFREKDDHTAQAESIFAIPKKGLIPLAIMSFCTMIAEGSVADWSAIYLDDVVNAPASLLGFGYAAFSLTMTLGRFLGDDLTARFGGQRLLIIGGLVAICGFVLTITFGLAVSLIGFAAIGAGFATIIPILFSTAGNMKGISASYGIASVASVGYFGFLLGPVFIGMVAEYQGLKMSFLLLALLTVFSVFLAFCRFPKSQ